MIRRYFRTEAATAGLFSFALSRDKTDVKIGKPTFTAITLQLFLKPDVQKDTVENSDRMRRKRSV